MIFDIVLKSNKEDKFSVAESASEKMIILPSYNLEEGNYLISHNINRILTKYKLSPSDNISDFMNLSLAVYVADQLISRKAYGFYNWSRHFKLHIPVVDKVLWEINKESIEQILSFLSGDKWELFFRKRNSHLNETFNIKSNIKNVCLFSGGLDSFIGGINALVDFSDTILVSHHRISNSGEKSIQIELAKELKDEFKLKDLTHLPFFVQAQNKRNNYGGESTQRARSIIFIALGLITANSYGDQTTVLIPENGLISLNIPLTMTRLGSFSTKTTHPKFIHSINELLVNLGIKNKLINPYKFFTKGEMILNSQRFDIVQKYANKTLSCSKVGYYKRWKGAAEDQCGFCTPCIIRRAAMKKASISKHDSKYYLDIKKNLPSPNEKRGRDLQAFKIGIERQKKEKDKILFTLLSVGSLPGLEKDLKNYIEVYKRGMKEVEEFIK